MSGYNSHVKFQRTTNYFDLNLREETNKYIYRILTLYLIENADSLGFHVKDEEENQPINICSIVVSSDIPGLAEFALTNGSTYKAI
ncbi:MAG: hypothetical protein ACM3VS_07105 [Candidatus Dadabacteria bacterium]